MKHWLNIFEYKFLWPIFGLKRDGNVKNRKIHKELRISQFVTFT